LIEPEFQSTTWIAFRETALAERSPKDVAGELGISTNAVYVARCRVVKRLYDELEGLLD
jgi:RNA polymerase sigma-70 factor (ECF subfamily)